MTSTSAVTRATNAPRFCSLCSAMDSSWTCSNARTRSVASARSVAVTNRTYVPRAATYRHETASAARPPAHRTNRELRPCVAEKPRSRMSWIRMGTTSRPAVMARASPIVYPIPARSSGLSCSPRRRRWRAPSISGSSSAGPSSSLRSRGGSPSKPPGGTTSSVGGGGLRLPVSRTSAARSVRFERRARARSASRSSATSSRGSSWVLTPHLARTLEPSPGTGQTRAVPRGSPRRRCARPPGTARGRPG